MKKIQSVIVLFTIVILLTSSVLGASHTQLFNQSHELTDDTQNDEKYIASSPVGGSRYNIQGWVYINIKGEPYTRGYQYGYLAGEEIVDLMQRWSKMILNHPRIRPIRSTLSQEQYENVAQEWWDFCKQLAERMYWDEYPEEYRIEIRGIAAGVTERGLTLYGEPISYKDVLASNEMYEMLSKLTEGGIRYKFHPLFDLYHALKPEIKQHSSFSAETFVDDFVGNADESFHHKCSSFIATGNATTDGQLILSNSMWSTSDGSTWWWAHYISIRWNIILDVIPTTGNRFQMSCAPGYIWSDHDFYQNEAGICFIETTVHQGIWIEQGLPLAVRARKAVQYADTIDEVIYYLRTNNDGIMNAVWLIGNTNTGEIARYELGLYQDAVVNRTKNGFLWSSNNPMDFNVRMEKMDWKELINQLLKNVLFGANFYQYYTPWYLPAARDVVFQDLGNKYYGDIDIDVVKQIMGTDPIGTFSPDCKITSTNLLKHNGLVVHTGNPGGEMLSMANFDSPDVPYESLKPVGWVEVFGLPETHTVQVNRNGQQNQIEVEEEWKVALESNSNDFYSFSTWVEGVIYSTTSTGMLYAVSADEKEVLWSKDVGNHPTEPVISGNQLFVGSDEGLHLIDLGWMTLGTKPIGEVEGNPVVNDDFVFVGTKNQNVYAIEKGSGVIAWQIAVDGIPYLSNVHNEIVIIGAEETVYAVNTSDGSILWSHNIDGLVTSSPFQDEDIVFVGSWSTNLDALDSDDGSLLWTVDTGWGIESTPVIFEDMVIFGSHDQNVYAVDVETGEEQWVFSCQAGIHTDPVIWQDSVVIGSDDGRLYRFDAETGSLVWSFAPGNVIDDVTRNYITTPIRSSVAVSDDTLFVGVLGQLYSLK
ncbi:MAG: PQQ-binding-like beta-propeller repeat protein [Candidatus Thermoplasmatota archaeon]|nr:PQQ-binding-like beta-propeller repeat protein [Candidatus Thermoplasmatota archaeon]